MSLMKLVEILLLSVTDAFPNAELNVPTVVVEINIKATNDTKAIK